MSSFPSYDQIVQSIYRAATGSTPWHEALHLMNLGLGGQFSQLVAVDKASGRLALSLHSTAAPMEGVLYYMREFHRHDPHVTHALTLESGQVFNTDRLITSAQARGLSFYRDFWSVYDVRYGVAGKVAEDEGVVALYGAFRSADLGPFDAKSDTLLARLMPHLGEAFHIYRRVSALAATADVGRLVIDRSSRPTVLLDAQRFIVHANAAAQQLLLEGSTLVARAGHLGCRHPAAEVLLVRELAALGLDQTDAKAHAAEAPRRAFALRDLHDLPVPACLWALRPAATMGAFGGLPRALLILPTQRSAEHVDPVVLEASYDLTPAEGRVLGLLSQALNVKIVARTLGISVHTVRCHLTSIFDKTGFRSQKELLRHVHDVFSI